MKVFTMDDLSYRGKHKGVHSWDHPGSTTPYYWHPDWLHIAEDALGEHKKADLEVPDGETATEEHAKAAILKHLNDE
ncbi:hypothetical protein QNE88_003810 [Vibrio alginolyticus]|jgi:cell wall assembly regulator SMI1|uniref:Uncharacterized protein n=1 Tax=Vibrio alginolyticus TaxID=663 RepID=A0A1W6TSK0_VIBAL|nr:MULTISPECIES: hypothetical protein [Vibrio]MDW1808581.1 hypothetical protein [Vibrio sp. Vb2362]MDW2257887.1 hypothetical protein [Vibrio sp. 1409]MDW2294674.1 hypothetical protein [Vibrio sp. 1404]QCO86466.1 hypothetical protein D3H41_10400 [Vibrio neocaledonicus]GAK18104.1 hypothetical protein JCM19053_1605 [Vibrio sp. JCM 19053]